MCLKLTLPVPGGPCNRVTAAIFSALLPAADSHTPCDGRVQIEAIASNWDVLKLVERAFHKAFGTVTGQLGIEVSEHFNIGVCCCKDTVCNVIDYMMQKIS